MQSINEVVREEIRALHIEKSLSGYVGYVMVCCMEDVPKEEMREILFTRVLSMVGPALQKAEKRSGVGAQRNWVKLSSRHCPRSQPRGR